MQKKFLMRIFIVQVGINHCVTVKLKTFETIFAFKNLSVWHVHLSSF